LHPYRPANLSSPLVGDDVCGRRQKRKAREKSRCIRWADV